MSGIAYTVTATFPDERTASEYVEWLLGGHIDQVVAGGAESGMVVRVEDPPSPIRVEARYIFPSRAAYAGYIEHHAPALRAEGLRRFGSDPRVSFERRTGQVL